MGSSPGQMPPGYFPQMMPHAQYPFSYGPMYSSYPPSMTYAMHPPSTPANASRATPKKSSGTNTTPAKRKDRRNNDANLTVDTVDLSMEMQTPRSPPSSKKKRELLGVGTWLSPPEYEIDDLVSRYES